MEWKLLTKTRSLLLGLLLVAAAWSPAQANPLGIPDVEYNALVALYNSTGGAGWKNSSNWLTATPGWYGVTVTGGRVTRLSLSGNQLSGSIPAQLGSLSRLAELNLGSNQLAGAIPASLGSLSNLQVLRLDGNGLTGSIPPEFGLLANLQYLRLDSNRLTGGIPPEIGGIASLQYLRLSSNRLTGDIPVTLGNLSNLNDLRLGENRLTGAIPRELRYLASLQYLDLHSNQLTGTIPTWLGVLSSITDVDLGSNKFSGPIPAELGNLVLLQSLRLGDNALTGTIPASLGGLSNLVYLHLQSNRLEGPLPASFANLTKLKQLYLRTNKLAGAIPPGMMGLSQLENGAGMTLNYNGLYAASAELRDFVTSRSTGDSPEWWRTQTVAPEGISSDPAIGASVRLEWTPILYAGDAGYYEVGFSSTPGGPYTALATNRTGQKTASVITASGLLAGQNYVAVRTVTLPHGRNQNTVVSAWSADTPVMVAAQPNPLGVPEAEHDALVALYNSTGGANWAQNANWLTAAPNWYGVTVAGGHVLALVLPSNNLSGPLPEEIGALRHLAVAILYDNALTGPIPASLGNLSGLQTLWLGGNQLSGAIPSELGGLASLVWLDLSSNQLSGPVPASLGNLGGLQQMLLASNKLTGEIPSSFGGLTGLIPAIGLSLDHNGLFAADAGLAAFLQAKGSSFGEWQTTQTLAPGGFAAGPPVGGSVVFSWTPIAYTGDPGYYEIGVSPAPGGPYVFDPALRTASKLSSGMAVDGLAPGVHYFVARAVTLPNAWNQNTVASLLSAEAEVTIAGANNPLGIPDEEYSALVALYNATDGRDWTNDTNWLTTNKLWHGVTVANGHVTSLSLAGNQLTGTLPPELGDLRALTSLNLGSNQIGGVIPPELGEIASLQYVLLEGNQLTGSIPAALGSLTNLRSLGLSANQLTGAIPSELGNLAGLVFLDLASNQLTGSIPPSLGALSSLQQLNLRINRLTGAIPAELGNLTNLQTLNLQWNQISGEIPSELGNLANLQQLNLSNNELEGEIPADLGRLTDLVFLYLERNHLSGPIPVDLCGLTDLTDLSLGYNRLAGEIPAEFANFTGLRHGDGLSIVHNGLFTADQDLEAFVSAKSSSSGDWRDTQTVAPAQVAAARPSGASVSLSWEPILYSADAGYYEVGVGASEEGPFTFEAVNRTEDKSADGLTVGNLPAGKLYFVVRAVTLPNAANQNTVTSVPSAPVSMVVSRPSTGAISPSSGSILPGSRQTFVATFEDPDGYEDIADCRILINTALSGVNAVFVYFDIANNKIYLRSDANNTWLGGFAPGSANAIENSRCVVHCDAATVTGSGAGLTVSCPITLKPVLTGKTLNEWLYVGDRDGHGDGWNLAGEITPGSSAPANVSVSPASGIVPTNQQVTFTAVHSDPNGFADLKASYMLINTTQSGVNAAYVLYDGAANKLFLRDDANSAWLGGFAPGSANTIENARVKVNCAGTAIAGAGNELSVNWRLEFKPLMQGRKCGIWIYAADSANLATGFDRKGEVTFVIPAPSNVSVSPNSGVVPTVQETTFTTVQSDPSGHADLKSSFLLIGSAVSGVGAVYVWYDASENKLYLRNDGDTAWLGGFAPGSANTIENSRVKVLCEQTAVNGAGNALTVNWRLQIKPAMLGRKCSVYIYAADMSGLNTGFEKKGEVLFDQAPVNDALDPHGVNALADGMTTIVRAKYADGDGFEDISGAYLVVNTALSSFRGISLYYDAAANKLYLRDDLNTAWLGGFEPGQAGAVMQNGYCKVDCAATTVDRSGDTLQVNWSIEPKASTHARAMKAWMYVTDAAGVTDGWDEKAAFTIGAEGLNISLRPSAAEAAVGETIALTANCWAPGGPASTTTYLIINTTRTGADGVYLYYEGSNNLMYLRDDANSAWLGGFAPGSAHTISNGLVTLDCAGSSVDVAGDQIEVRWSLRFSENAAGRSMTAWMYTLDTAGQSDGWDEVGALTVEGP